MTSDNPVSAAETAEYTNVIKNPGFESGKTSWAFYTNAAGATFNAAPPGHEGNNSAKLAFSKVGTNMQLYQSGVSLEPNTVYRLSFAAYSTTGHDITLKLLKSVSPFTSYGLVRTFNLGTGWQDFTTEFTTKGFSGPVNDGRLQFWLVPFAKAGDTYYIDDVRLEKVSDPAGLPGITTHPSGQTVMEGQAATFSAAATGTSLSYQWQKNGVNIPGATNAAYITPSATLADNGAIFRVIVSNAAGSVMSNIATLTVLPAASTNIVKNPGFESGKTSWTFYTNGAGTFSTVSPGYEGNYSTKLAFSTAGTNMQLYQSGISLEPNTRYRLSFAAYSTTGHDVRIRLFKQVSPYPPYGLDYTAHLGMNWQNFTTEFTTKGFSSPVNDSRLQFWLVPFAAAGDTYFIDDVRLEKIIYNDTTLPDITLWYGNSQRFGHIDIPQKWVNILGNVQDESGIASMNYSLNNGSAQPLSAGPDGLRLQSMGDFNVEINRSDLWCGDNRLVIRAADNAGNSNNETVSINYSCNNVLPGNYKINWSDVASIQDAAQIADGLWVKEANSIRPAVIGYDRLITIGNMTWDDYEIAAPITINTPLDLSARSGGPNVGFGMRWQGHSDWDNMHQYPTAWNGVQPRVAWYPLGALGVYIWNQSARDFQLTLIGNDMQVIDRDMSGKHLAVGVTYIFKMRAETIGSRTLYSLKVWEQNKSEPSAWIISGYGISGELKQGSLTLNSHYVNASFGNVTIRYK